MNNKSSCVFLTVQKFTSIYRMQKEQGNVNYVYVKLRETLFTILRKVIMLMR